MTGTILLSGFVMGVICASLYSVVLMVKQDRRHAEESRLYRRTIAELEGAAVAPTPSLPDLDGTTQWVKHTEHHWTCYLGGDLMQYWPSASKWRWRNRTYTGRINEFLRAVEDEVEHG